MIPIPTCKEKSGERSYNRVNGHSFSRTRSSAKYTNGMAEWELDENGELILTPPKKKTYEEALADYVENYVVDVLNPGPDMEEFERLWQHQTRRPPPLEFGVRTDAEERLLEAEDDLSYWKRRLRKIERAKEIADSPEMAEYRRKREESERRFREMGMDVSDPGLENTEEGQRIIDWANLARKERWRDNVKGNMAAMGVPETVYDFPVEYRSPYDAYFMEEAAIEEGVPYVLINETDRIKGYERHPSDPRNDPKLYREAFETDPNSDAGFMLQQRLLGMNPKAVDLWRMDNAESHDIYQTNFRPFPEVTVPEGLGPGLQPVPPVPEYDIPKNLLFPPQK